MTNDNIVVSLRAFEDDADFKAMVLSVAAKLTPYNMKAPVDQREEIHEAGTHEKAIEIASRIARGGHEYVVILMRKMVEKGLWAITESARDGTCRRPSDYIKWLQGCLDGQVATWDSATQAIINAIITDTLPTLLEHGYHVSDLALSSLIDIQMNPHVPSVMNCAYRAISAVKRAGRAVTDTIAQLVHLCIERDLRKPLEAFLKLGATQEAALKLLPLAKANDDVHVRALLEQTLDVTDDGKIPLLWRQWKDSEGDYEEWIIRARTPAERALIEKALRKARIFSLEKPV